GDTAYDVIGVVADYAVSPSQTYGGFAKVFFPLPLDAKHIRRLAFIVRAEGDPGPLVQPLRRRTQAAMGGTTVDNAYTFDELRAVASQELLVGTAPLVPLVAIGTLLTTSGIYGVLAFAITRRSRELAVRRAIGAAPGDIARLVARHAVWLAGMGGALGIGLTFILARIVRASGGAGS